MNVWDQSEALVALALSLRPQTLADVAVQCSLAVGAASRGIDCDLTSAQQAALMRQIVRVLTGAAAVASRESEVDPGFVGRDVDGWLAGWLAGQDKCRMLR